MGLVWRNFNYRIYPTNEQISRINKIFGCVRFVYNHYLEIGREKHLTDGIYPSLQNNLNDLPFLFMKHEFLRNADKTALESAVRQLSNAQKMHANRFCEEPKFKSKKYARQSYTTIFGKRKDILKEGKLDLPIVGKVKITLHRMIPDNFEMYSAAIIKKASNQYETSIAMFCPDHEFDIKDYKNATAISQEPIQSRDNLNAIGLDFSMPDLLVDSNGKSASYPKYYRMMLEKLRKSQRKLSLCERGSNNYEKQRIKVSRAMQKCADQRKDFHHKLSSEFAEKYDLVCVENISVKNLIRFNKLGKSAFDDGWYTFVNMLNYKLEERNKHLQMVDRWFPSTKKCSNCGKVKKAMPLSERTFKCECGNILSRDHNAAINIRNEGVRIFLSKQMKN